MLHVILHKVDDVLWSETRSASELMTYGKIKNMYIIIISIIITTIIVPKITNQSMCFKHLSN